MAVRRNPGAAFAGLADEAGAVSGAVFIAHSGLPGQSTLQRWQQFVNLLEARQALFLLSAAFRSLDSSELHFRSRICARLPVNAAELPWIMIACGCSGIFWAMNLWRVDRCGLRLRNCQGFAAMSRHATYRCRYDNPMRVNQAKVLHANRAPAQLWHLVSGMAPVAVHMSKRRGNGGNRRLPDAVEAY